MQKYNGWLQTRRYVLYLFVMAASLPVSTAFGDSQQAQQMPDKKISALQDIIGKAKGEGGTIDILNASIAEPDFMNAVSQGMSKKYGFPIRLNIVTGPSPSALAPQLVQEFKAGRRSSSDVFAGDDVNAMVLINANAVINSDWKAIAPALPNEVIGPKGSFLRLSSRIIGSLWYNTNLVKPQDVPRSLKDVLNPKWKGRVATTSFMAGFREAGGLFGKEQEMKDFLRAFRKSGNIGGFIRGGEAHRIASGEFAMMVGTTSEAAVILLQKKGAPIAFTILPEMPIISFWVMTIPKNSAHPNLGKLFMHYMTTRDGQDSYYKVESRDLHYLEGSKSALVFKKVMRDIKPQIVTNDILLSRFKNFNRVRRELKKILKRGK